MKRIKTSRYYQMVAFILVLMAVLAIRLFVLTIVEHDEWVGYASNMSQKNIIEAAPRGDIYDRHGRLLAGSVQAFSVKFDSTGMENDEINQVALDVIRILEANGDTYYDNFPIVQDNGNLVFTYDNEINTWLSNEGLPSYYTAEQAFNEIRNRLDIEPGLTKYEAQIEMQDVYKVFPPISVLKMQYTQEIYKSTFLSKFNLKGNLTAQQAFDKLSEKYEIGDHYTLEEKRKILLVRNEIADLGYSKYMAATIAKGISKESNIALNEKSDDLTGVEVVSDTQRFYPMGSTASHVLGYLGKISEANKAEYVDKWGYNPNDLIGQSGIESVYEKELKGTDGIKVIQVNSDGEAVAVINETEPAKGKDVYLTIDAELQKVAEDALEQGLTQIQRGGTFKSEYGDFGYGKSFQNANVGAVVAIDVETADVLALANYPDFDPNLFTTGISSKDWQALQSTNPRDSLAPAPLYNVAARSAVQPGSTFKMVVATAALKEGLDPTQKLKDGGYVQVGNRAFHCLIHTSTGGNHGYIDLPHALEVSCNYYFYDISTGKDYYTGKSLGYNIEVADIMDIAKQYGLGLPTGIEVSETVKEVPSAERKLATTKISLKNVLKSRAKTYFKADVIADADLLDGYINTIVGWTEENPTRGELIERVVNYGVKEDMAESITDLCKYSYFNQATIKVSDEFNLAIGQGENAYTPLQMANYVATIGNKGYHNQVSLVKAVQGTKTTEKAEATKVDITEKNLQYIIDGMVLVANGSEGSLTRAFGNFPVTVAAKSGTAENSGVIQPKDEVEYIKRYLRSINPRLSWTAVEAEMNRLLTEEGDVYKSTHTAVDKAVINLSDGKVTMANINRYKRPYDNFAWVVALAPAEDPKIAVAALVVQGGTAGYASPIVREVIGKYLELDKVYTETDLTTVLN